MTPRPVEHALLMARTLRRLRPAQVAHRVRLRGQRFALSRAPASVVARLARPVPERPGWPAGLIPLDGRLAAGPSVAEAAADGRFCFLADKRDLGRNPCWDAPGAARLWRFHLHGLEWAWAFAAHPDRVWASAELRRLWRSWRAAAPPVGRGDAWSPYVAASRAWSLCGVFGPLIEGSEDEPAVVGDLALHGGYLRAHLELDVGGNHLVKDLKAVMGVGVFLDDDALVAPARRRLAAELGRQVLADGGHYERSPSYHAQVLGDLLDVRDLLAAARRPPVDGLDEAVDGMRSWLGAMLLPDGDVPLFNDCVLIGHERLGLLGPGPAPADRLTVLQPSGYVVVRLGDRLHLVADVGPPCPPDLPAHAHADCLSFELAVDGRRLVVDAGASTYEPGRRRTHERSTAAHNTVEVDGVDQTEVWATFRAARRATPCLEAATDEVGIVVVTASHDGYERLPGRPRHRRTWRVDPRQVEIVDEISGVGDHRVVHRLVFASGTDVEHLGGDEFRAGPAEIKFAGGRTMVVPVDIATGFGQREAAQSVVLSAAGDLPLRLVARITCGGGT